MSDRVEEMEAAQQRLLKIYGNPVPEGGSVDNVVMTANMLGSRIDCETRHLTLAVTGLSASLARLFVECLCAMRGREAMPEDVDELMAMLRHDIFAPRNIRYGDSFARFGAAGVVIRLLDHARVLEKTRSTMSVAHIANYTAMATMLLLDNDPEFS